MVNMNNLFIINRKKNIENIDSINDINKKIDKNNKSEWDFLHTKDRKIHELIYNVKVVKNIPKEELFLLWKYLVDQLIIISKQLIVFQESKINHIISKRWNLINKELNKTIHKYIKKIINFKKYNNDIELKNNSIIELKSVSKIYSTPAINTKVLDNVSLHIDEGDFVVILGPSGSGKTSLMNLISGIDQPTYGSINVAGFNLQKLSNSSLTNFRQVIIGYIFQRYGLLPNLTVFENVAMGSFLGENLSKSKSKLLSSRILASDEKNINDILDWVDMLNCKDKYPYELSGGQKQRTSIARTIAKLPKIIFGDEPTAAVDEQMSSSIVDLFCKINKVYKTTIIIITHDEKIALHANRVIYVKDGNIEKVVLNKKKG